MLLSKVFNLQNNVRCSPCIMQKC